ncbi:respiratory nitrate reductase subunit gamma [Kitasatospora sp. NPDC101235]|uniref:respiratory nitrate reductase subunit gamma n=1 Tax=Kitasatospora sp. NPDC101235 TaxID=3364101 RepID=UPI0038050A81
MAESTSEPGELLLWAGRFFHPGKASADLHRVVVEGGREGDVFYRDRWSHDKVVHSTHGVNCTGSCRWKVYVKDGIITWETQATDYPSVGPDRPEYEPRGCPRGAAFSWYTYSPTRVRYPYVRGVLLELFREAKARLGDPVLAWADLQADPERRRRYQRARGKGGLVRAGWDEAVERRAHRRAVVRQAAALCLVHPDAELYRRLPLLRGLWATVPATYQAHAVLGMLVIAVVPYTRLVHMFSAPWFYLFRPHLVYRSRPAGQRAERPPRRGWESIDT